jgi:hypothetical protein
LGTLFTEIVDIITELTETTTTQDLKNLKERADSALSLIIELTEYDAASRIVDLLAIVTDRNASLSDMISAVQRILMIDGSTAAGLSKSLRMLGT